MVVERAEDGEENAVLMKLESSKSYSFVKVYDDCWFYTLCVDDRSEI